MLGLIYRRRLWFCLVGIVVCFCRPGASGVCAAEGLDREAANAMRKAVEFFHHQVAVHGGYVYQVTSDLKHREGEGDAGMENVWVQPPGTPAVGLAYVEAYQRTGEPYLLAAAMDAAKCLLRGQLHSGGWQNHIDFDPKLRGKLAYRVDGRPGKRARNWSSFDDDQTQSALRFLMQLDKALEFKDPEIHDAVQYGLNAVLENQFPNGAWPQGFERLDRSRQYPRVSANYPNDWPREYPGGDYWQYYTLNDGALVRVIQTVRLAADIYQDSRCREAAERAAHFLIAAQMPDPQPGWAQQYNYDMQPIWARKFEPPAISGGESQGVIEALLDLTSSTGEKKYLAAVGRALAYLEKSELPGEELARFYELKTNRPLYFTRDYVLTHDDGDLPTHYSFKVKSNLKRLRSRYERLMDQLPSEIVDAHQRDQERREKSLPSDGNIRKLISSLDERGAWVEPGQLRYIKKVPRDQELILSATFIKNLDQLSKYLASSPSAQKSRSDGRQ